MVQFWAPPISIVGKNTMELLGYKHCLKYLPLCSPEQRIHTGLEQHEGE